MKTAIMEAVDRKESARMYQTENDIPQKRRAELNMLMNQRLADAVDLQSQMKQARLTGNLLCITK